MNRYYSDENRLLQIGIGIFSTSGPEISDNVELFHVICGKALLKLRHEEIQLAENDIRLVNPGDVYEIEVSDGTVCTRVTLAMPSLRSLVGQRDVSFASSLQQRDEKAYARLEMLLWRIYEIAVGNDKSAKIQYMSQYYQLIELLAVAFREEESGSASSGDSTEIRDRQILQYIRSRYTEQITLDSLAGELFLTNAYLSKYIKKRFRMNYLELVNSVRLSHAVEMLKNTGDTMTRIAMANGFASMASFNKVFQDAYGVTPMEYRKTYRTALSGNSEKEPVKEELPSWAEEKLHAAFLEFKNREEKAAAIVRLETCVDALSNRYVPLKRCWQTVINAGTAYNLTRSDYQQQLLYLKEKIGFEYVRFWDVFSSELRINIHEAPENANFSALFRIIDFLIDHNIKPFFELAFKPIRIMRNPKDAIIDEHRYDLFKSTEELRCFVTELVRQLVARYGNREVSSWYFEYWKIDPLMFYVDENKQKNFSEPNAKYFEEFEALASGIRGVLPLAKIGGGGFTFRTYGESGMAQIFDLWKLHRCLPDFISLNCFQYRNIYLDNGDFIQERYEDSDFIARSIQATRRIMRERNFPDKKIFVTEFNLTVSNRSVINDSCSKAAQLLQLVFSSIDYTDALAYWTAMDAYAEYSDTKGILFGGVGLLSKDGIPKPSLFAFEFLNRLDDEMVEKTRDYIITRSGASSFKILCHNFRGYTPEYYARNENQIGIKEFASFSADDREKHIHLVLKNIPNGKYQIRIREVNSRSGSIQGVWQRLNFDSHLDREDLAFVRQMCVPGMSRMDADVGNGILEFDLRLAPNSIKYAHFVRRDY